MTGDDGGVQKVVGDIVRYIAQHPRAADSFDGIWQWWIPRQRYEDSRAAVEQALAELERRGVLKRSTLLDGTVVYSKR
jgi:hypothetical protein